MKEYDKIVEAAWEAIENRKHEIEQVVAELWEIKYRMRYLKWMTDRQRRLDLLGTSWAQFSR